MIMKTYEETLKSVLRKAAECEKQNEKRKKRLSLIAAVAAALILFTALPVGAFIISRQAKQPVSADTDSQLSAEFVTDENGVFKKIEISDISEMIITAEDPSNIVDMTAAAAPLSELPARFRMDKDGERYLYFNNELEGNKPTEDGLLRRTYAQFAHVFTGNENNYQIDIVFSDGEKEICHETYVGQKDLQGMINIIFDFYLLVPYDLEYGELRFYFNLLESGAETISEYDVDPYNKMCVGFAQKYQCMRVSYGDEMPERSREELLAHVDRDLHEYIYGYVDLLYKINRGEGLVVSAERREFMKEMCTKILKAYKNENEEAYAEIIKEFCDNEAGETYDSNGNLIDKPHLRHDPLEDITP